MDLDFVSVHKHAKKELGQYPAIFTWHLVNNPYKLQLSYSLAINETRVDGSISDQDVEVEGYDVIRCDQTFNGRFGGGFSAFITLRAVSFILPRQIEKRKGVSFFFPICLGGSKETLPAGYCSVWYSFEHKLRCLRGFAWSSPGNETSKPNSKTSVASSWYRLPNSSDLFPPHAGT